MKTKTQRNVKIDRAIRINAGSLVSGKVTKKKWRTIITPIRINGVNVKSPFRFSRDEKSIENAKNISG